MFWNIKTAESIYSLDSHDEAIRSVGLAGHNILYSGGWDRTIKLWHITENFGKLGLKLIETFKITPGICTMGVIPSRFKFVVGGGNPGRVVEVILGEDLWK